MFFEDLLYHTLIFPYSTRNSGVKNDRIELEVPGYGTGDVSVSVKERILEVKGSLEGKEFYREYQLGTTVDTDAMQVTLDKGVLTITLPLKAGNEPRKLEVRGPG